ncbi:unnamed protein product [Adineta steineri]|uniref:NHL repeat containing protein-like protein n=1 Tax=Adineta steineri TaxID=433720 RepID=A0A813NQU3_9BILA|nr:unnamed protein product [Adineta steineri]CAF0739054.1 unnamed protein product [Adineta steineri]CAF0748904.1 unnamed protein product [Adineta steineri]
MEKSSVKSTPCRSIMSMETLSFNQPKFCPTAIWDTNGINFADKTTVGSNPTGIFIDTNNTVYVPHGQNKQILVWFNGSNYPAKIISANISNSRSIFVTNNGNIFIDNGELNGRVDKWISNTNTFVNVMNVNASCRGLFVDINDTLYCSMYRHHQVVKRWMNDESMTSVIAAGTGKAGPGLNELNRPEGIFVDVNFDLYVADCYNRRIQLFHSGESNGTTVAGESSPNRTIRLGCPTAIVLDAQKYLFIADIVNDDYDRIVGSGPNGFQCLVGCNRWGSFSRELASPQTISFDTYGNMFVTDSDHNRIQKFLSLENCCGKLRIV